MRKDLPLSVSMLLCFPLNASWIEPSIYRLPLPDIHGNQPNAGLLVLRQLLITATGNATLYMQCSRSLSGHDLQPCSPVHCKGPPVQEDRDVRGRQVGINELGFVVKLVNEHQLQGVHVPHCYLQPAPDNQQNDPQGSKAQTPLNSTSTIFQVSCKKVRMVSYVSPAHVCRMSWKDLIQPLPHNLSPDTCQSRHS
jgi:hypothetical protein